METFLKEAMAKLEQPLSGPLVEELRAENNQVSVAVAKCREKQQKLCQRA